MPVTCRRHRAAEEIAVAAGIAQTAMSAVPAHAHALAGFPLRHARAHGIHHAHDFMAGHTRILDARPVAFLHQRIAVADAAGLDFDPHLAGGGLWNFTFNDFKRSAGAGDLGSAHFWHKSMGSVFMRRRRKSDTLLPADNQKYFSSCQFHWQTRFASANRVCLARRTRFNQQLRQNTQRQSFQ